MKRISLFLLLVFFMATGSKSLTAQATAAAPAGVDHSYKPLKVNLNEDGSKYIRFIMWHQLWITSNNLSAENANLQLSNSIRRSRFLAYAQISPRFLVLTHFGLNSLTPNNLSALGSDSNSPQLFLHDAWGEYKLHDNLYMGAGLHYWKGLTRSASQSTLNFMTLDQSRPFVSWHSLGITDQFARHLGVYLKGDKGKVEYRFAWNNPGRNPLGGGRDYSSSFTADGVANSTLTYTGASVADSDGNAVGNSLFEGYVKYNFWDNESTKLPYYVGTYMGAKKVLSVGGGFFLHPNGMYDTATGDHSNVTHLALDAFLDMPTNSGALNAYAAFWKFDYGENYVSRWAGTGTSFYGQVGYYIKSAKLMPYVAYGSSNFDGVDNAVSSTDIGANYFINGHNAKVTAEYHIISNDLREGTPDFSQFRLQMHFFL